MKSDESGSCHVDCWCPPPQTHASCCSICHIADRAAMTAVVQKAPGESVEWVNMCFRKIWRVYQRGLERWITDLLQPVFDGLISVSVNIQYMAS